MQEAYIPWGGEPSKKAHKKGKELFDRKKKSESEEERERLKKRKRGIDAAIGGFSRHIPGHQKGGPMKDRKQRNESLNFTDFCNSFVDPLWEAEGGLPKCPPGYRYNKKTMQCEPKTDKDDVRVDKGGKTSSPENSPKYNVWGATGINGDGYAWAERNNWGGNDGGAEAVPYSEEYIDEAKLPRAQKRKKKKSKGTLHAYDMDETLFSDSKSRVRVRDKEGNVKRELDNQQFNSDKKGDDEDYDFDDFRKAKNHGKNVKANKKMVKHLKKNLKRNKPVEIITARADFDDKEEFAKTFKRHGINIDPKARKGVHVRRVGNETTGTIGDRKTNTAADSAKRRGVKRVRMYDDSSHVLKDMKDKMKKDHPDIDYKGKKVEKGKDGQARQRRFREFVELEEKKTLATKAIDALLAGSLAASTMQTPAHMVGFAKNLSPSVHHAQYVQRTRPRNNDKAPVKRRGDQKK